MLLLLLLLLLLQPAFPPFRWSLLPLLSSASEASGECQGDSFGGRTGGGRGGGTPLTAIIGQEAGGVVEIGQEGGGTERWGCV